MKLFNRGAGTEAPTGATPAPPPEPGAPPPQGAEPPAPSAPPEPDPLAAALDASVKEIAEKLSRLSTSVEGVREERAQFDEKFGKMEERMRKLSALAEMISTQYNPFLGAEPPARESAVAAVQPVVAAQFAAEVRPPKAAPRPTPAPFAGLAAAPPPAPAPPAPAPPEPEWAKSAPVPGDEDASAEGPFLTRVDNSFQNSMTLLQWSELLLRAAGRDGLPDLLDYYAALGWIGPDVRGLIQTYAKGLHVEKEGTGDWRARVDLHEKSLVFVEKLRPRRR